MNNKNLRNNIFVTLQMSNFHNYCKGEFFLSLIKERKTYLKMCALDGKLIFRSRLKSNL